MSYVDWVGWQTFFQVEPWGWREEWKRHAQTTYYVAAPYLDKSEGRRTIEDYMPQRREDSPLSDGPQKEAARILRNLEAFKLALGVKDDRRRPRYE